MFDNIKCELPLPLNKKEQKTFSNVDWNDRVFQTKDTDCTLSTYTIRKNGKLYGLFIEGENVRVISEKEEKKIKRKGKFCWPYKFKEKSRKYKFEKFTGDLYFYDHVIDKDGNEWWVEFVAKFVDGVIKGKIKKKEVRFSQSAEDIKKFKEDWQERIAKEQAKLSTKIKRNLNKYT
ncbi:MAG: hypothetical protein EBQ92_13840, partial [Proteobacteria bacterium]|nr:hypothetical protein [Pseudomonadota bacterium]